MGEVPVNETPWAEEANRLLDVWAEAKAEARRLGNAASKASHDERAAREKFDNFVERCASVRANVLYHHPTGGPNEE